MYVCKYVCRDSSGMYVCIWQERGAGDGEGAEDLYAANQVCMFLPNPL